MMNQTAEPRLFLLDADALRAVRRSIFLGEDRFRAADDRLLREADQALQEGPFSVVDKEAVPPSGDKHDYMSRGTYWWPDPDKPDGLPYVRRDGEVNPEIYDYDSRRLGRMCSSVDTLALAYFLSDYEDFAERAALLLRTWFLDEARRMNPHLEYGQGIPGICKGRGIGIIDTWRLLPDGPARTGKGCGPGSPPISTGFWRATTDGARRASRTTTEPGTTCR